MRNPGTIRTLEDGRRWNGLAYVHDTFQPGCTCDTCRPTPPRDTPWGRSDHATEIIRGMWTVSTPSHGGIWLSPERLAAVPDYLQRSWAGAPWFEEDVDWCIPFVVFEAELLLVQDEYTAATLKGNMHRDTLRNWRPDDYERFYGVRLQPGESMTRDEDTFYREHAQDWLVFSACTNSSYHHVPAGMVEVSATRGRRGNELPKDTRTFLVPAEEYSGTPGAHHRPWRHAFIVDLNRHQEVTNAAL